MKKTTLMTVIVALTFLGCKKDKDEPTTPGKKNVSWWAINNDTFRTTETKKYLNQSHFILRYGDDSATIGFYIDIDTANRNLNNDSFKLYGLNYGNLALFTDFKGVDGNYEVSPADSSIIYSVNENGKIKLTLAPTVYRKVISSPGGGASFSSDSVIVQGVFYEPYQ